MRMKTVRRHSSSVGAQLLCVVALAAALTGCDRAVSGVAVRDPNTPAGKILEKSALDDVLLSVDELDDILGTSTLDIKLDEKKLLDQSDAMADPSCAASAFGGQEELFGDSGYTGVRHQVFRESGAGSGYLAEQIVVSYPSGDDAKTLLEKAKTTWQDCAGTMTTYGSSGAVDWSVDDVESDDSSISQFSTLPDVSGGCSHSMDVSANVVVETWVCGPDSNGEALTIAKDIVKKVEEA